MIPLIKELFTSKQMATALFEGIWIGVLAFLGGALASYIDSEDISKAVTLGLAASVPVMLGLTTYGARNARRAINGGTP